MARLPFFGWCRFPFDGVDSLFCRCLSRLVSTRNLFFMASCNLSRRWQLAKALRKGPFQTQILMAGVDKRAESKDEASLFWMDYLGTLQKVRHG